MPKRLIDLDDDLLAAAQRELRTKGVSDTVRIALQQAAAKSARARQMSCVTVTARPHARRAARAPSGERTPPRAVGSTTSAIESP